MDFLPIAMASAFSVVAYLMVLISNRRLQLRKKKDSERQKEISDALRGSLAKSFDDFWMKSEYSSELIADYKINYINTLRNYLANYPSIETKADIQKQVNEEVRALKSRIETIEARFPQEATLEKIASVNDAILATQVETISNSIQAMQEKMLTKWDVAKVVFAILGSLGVIVAIIFGILNWLKP